MVSFKEFCDKNHYSMACTRNEAFVLGQKSRQAEIDELQKRVDQALNLIYLEKGNAECGAHGKDVSDFIFGFGHELHLILRSGK